MTEPPSIPALTEEQETYERLFGAQPEWHPADQQNEPTSDDDDLYRRLFGDPLKGNER